MQCALRVRADPRVGGASRTSIIVRAWLVSRTESSAVPSGTAWAADRSRRARPPRRQDRGARRGGFEYPGHARGVYAASRPGSGPVRRTRLVRYSVRLTLGFARVASSPRPAPARNRPVRRHAPVEDCDVYGAGQREQARRGRFVRVGRHPSSGRCARPDTYVELCAPPRNGTGACRGFSQRPMRAPEQSYR